MAVISIGDKVTWWLISLCTLHTLVIENNIKFQLVISENKDVLFLHP